MTDTAGRLFVISAPSGAGKSSVIGLLLELRPELVLSVSATTRAPRVGEEDGKSYHFITGEEFRKMIQRGEFLEYAEYVGELYGTPALPVRQYIAGGRDVILEIEVQGARQIMEKAPDAVTIFIVPPDMEELERRLRGRGTESDEKLAARLNRARMELEEKSRYAHIVINDDIERAAREISLIIGNREQGTGHRSYVLTSPDP